MNPIYKIKQINDDTGLNWITRPNSANNKEEKREYHIEVLKEAISLVELFRWQKDSLDQYKIGSMRESDWKAFYNFQEHVLTFCRRALDYLEY